MKLGASLQESGRAVRCNLRPAMKRDRGFSLPSLAGSVFTLLIVQGSSGGINSLLSQV